MELTHKTNFIKTKKYVYIENIVYIVFFYVLDILIKIDYNSFISIFNYIKLI